MLKKIFVILNVCTLVIALTACRNDDENEDYDTDYEYYADPEPTPEELRGQFELFFEENQESIIEAIATDGEDVRLELAAGYEFLMTILLDDIELDDENRTLYILAFEMTFSQMTDLFGGLAYEIKEAAEINHFRLTVIFADVSEEEIARSSFDAGLFLFDAGLSSNEEIDEEYEEETD